MEQVELACTSSSQVQIYGLVILVVFSVSLVRDVFLLRHSLALLPFLHDRMGRWLLHKRRISPTSLFARSHLKARSPRVSLEIPPVEKGTGRLYTTLYRVREPQVPRALWPLVGKMPHLTCRAPALKICFPQHLLKGQVHEGPVALSAARAAGQLCPLYSFCLLPQRLQAHPLSWP